MWYVVDSEYAIGPLPDPDVAVEYRKLWDDLWNKIKGTTRDSEVADIDVQGLREAGLKLIGVDDMEQTIKDHKTSAEFKSQSRNEINELLGYKDVTDYVVLDNGNFWVDRENEGVPIVQVGQEVVFVYKDQHYSGIVTNEARGRDNDVLRIELNKKSANKIFDLVKLADKLDGKGYIEEANQIDKIIFAMDFTSVSPVLETDKPLNNRELERAIRISIAAEHDATHFYELVADLVEDVNIKKLFNDVAAEEKVHVGEFEKVLQVLDKEDLKLVEKGKEEAAEKLGL